MLHMQTLENLLQCVAKLICYITFLWAFTDRVMLFPLRHISVLSVQQCTITKFNRLMDWLISTCAISTMEIANVSHPGGGVSPSAQYRADDPTPTTLLYIAYVMDYRHCVSCFACCTSGLLCQLHFLPGWGEVQVKVTDKWRGRSSPASLFSSSTDGWPHPPPAPAFQPPIGSQTQLVWVHWSRAIMWSVPSDPAFLGAEDQ